MNVKCYTGDPAEITVSNDHDMEFSVPQGSCLGPLLFLLYCNDLPLNLTLCRCILFADDTTIYKSHKNLTYLRWCLQDELSLLADWFKANKLTLILSKSVCMLFDEKGCKIEFDLNVNGIKLDTVEYTKFLGVWIDRKLRWDVHVGKLVLKIKRNLHLLQTGQNMLNFHAKKLIYSVEQVAKTPKQVYLLHQREM